VENPTGRVPACQRVWRRVSTRAWRRVGVRVNPFWRAGQEFPAASHFPGHRHQDHRENHRSLSMDNLGSTPAGGELVAVREAVDQLEAANTRAVEGGDQQSH